jgi:hypothetical protein
VNYLSMIRQQKAEVKLDLSCEIDCSMRPKDCSLCAKIKEKPGADVRGLKVYRKESGELIYSIVCACIET